MKTIKNKRKHAKIPKSKIKFEYPWKLEKVIAVIKEKWNVYGNFKGLKLNPLKFWPK